MLGQALPSRCKFGCRLAVWLVLGGEVRMRCAEGASKLVIGGEAAVWSCCTRRRRFRVNTFYFSHFRVQGLGHEAVGCSAEGAIVVLLVFSILEHLGFRTKQVVDRRKSIFQIKFHGGFRFFRTSFTHPWRCPHRIHEFSVPHLLTWSNSIHLAEGAVEWTHFIFYMLKYLHQGKLNCSTSKSVSFTFFPVNLFQLSTVLHGE